MKKFILFGSLLISFAANAQWPSTAEVKKWEAQAKQVTIVRDKYGVPHVYGKTDADAVFGLMYTQCEENFERIERNYLEMLGRRAEMEGEKLIYNDLLMRLIADSNDAKKDYLQSPLWLKKLLNAHADAINYFLYKHPEVRPVVLQKFEPWFHLMYTDGSVSATSTGGASIDEIRQFYENGPEKTDLAFNGIKEIEERGSNGFAIAPKRSASGNAMLYINPHVPFYFRSEAQMVSEEGLNAYGAATWGQFFIYQGFNENLGWMHTSGYTDVADLYEEKISKTSKGWMYEFDKKLLPVKSKSITIYYTVNGEKLAKTFTAYYTHHGPIVARRNNKWLALKEYNRSLKALIQSWKTTKAENLEEYTEAMRGLSNTTNNTVYADNKGNIAYWHGNFVPKRNPGYDYTLPVDGSTSATEWQGVHPLEETVHLINPSSGWMQNCNATPFTLAGESSPNKNNYPYYMAPDGQNARGLNAMRLLSNKDSITLDGLIEIGYNRYLAAFDILLPPLFKAFDAAPNTDSLKMTVKPAIDLLKAWNKETDTSSVATTVAIDWATKINALWPRAKTQEESTEWVGRFNAIASGIKGKVMLEQIRDVMNELTGKYGRWQVRWGAINRYQRLTGKFSEVYDDNKPSLSVPLSSSRWGSLPAFESRSMYSSKGRYGFSGNSFIAAVEFGEKVKAKTIVTGGHSNNPLSPHFKDQAEGFVYGKFKDVFFYKEDVMNNKEKVYHPGE